MKKVLTTIIIISIFETAIVAQNNFTKSIPVRQNQKVYMEFQYPELIKVSTWDNNEILFTGQVSINLGKNNDAFEITVQESDQNLNIESLIRNKNQLPRNIIIKKDGQKYLFEGADWNSSEIQEFYEEHGKDNISWISNGIDIEVILEIKIPRHIELDIYSKHGMIEILDLPATLIANSKHRGVDLSVPSGAKYKFELNTKHGEVYSNLDLDFDKGYGTTKPYNWSRILANLNGGGKKIILETQHGNLYLRTKK